MRRLGLLATLLLAGCGTLRVDRIKYAPDKGNDSCPLQAFQNEAAVGRPFEELCAIRTSKTQGLVEQAAPRALEEAKKQACRCGADAFIWVSSYRNDQREVRIRAIRFVDAKP